MLDLNSDLNCISNHQAKDKVVVHSINLVNTEGITNSLKHNFVTQTRKVDVGIHSEVAPTSQAQIHLIVIPLESINPMKTLQLLCRIVQKI